MNFHNLIELMDYFKTSGITEIDEVYIEGSETNKHMDKKQKMEKLHIR